MTNEIAFTVMMFIALLAGLYTIWWIRKEERQEEHEDKGPQKTNL